MLIVRKVGFEWCVCMVVLCCKQKRAYEMRISDGSSDVCSSDLVLVLNVELDGLIDLGVGIDGREAGVPTCCRVVGRYTDQPMHAALGLEPAIDRKRVE